ncbi:hypothetical protein ACFLS9_08795, partial [Bacteroidota bacterium]
LGETSNIKIPEVPPPPPPPEIKTENLLLAELVTPKSIVLGKILADKKDFNLDDDGDDDKKKISFTDDENVNWDVTLENGEIIELYKDGQRISDEKIEEYEDYIYEQLEDLRIDLEKKRWKKQHLRDWDSKKWDDEEWDHKNNYWDSEKFQKQMEKLHERLDVLKDIKFDFHFDDEDWNFEFDEEDWDFDFDDEDWEDKAHYWDSDEFQDHMEKLHERLDVLHDLKFDFKFDFDEEEFEESMEEFCESMKDFSIDMDDFNDSMADLKIDMKHLKVEMKKLKSFLNELREELVEDGYLEDEDEDFEMEFNEDEIIINGEKLPDSLHKKYLEIYEKHFDKELEGDLNFNID